MARLRAAATTEPGKLRIIGAVLAVLVITFGAVTAVEVSDRTAAADDVVSRSQPLSADAALVYRSLADADTAASSGFLAGAAAEPRAVRERYEKDITLASRLLVKAATHTDADSESGRQIRTLNEQLPFYAGFVETARSYNRQGKPLGGAYLRFANERMTKVLLPAAQKLYDAETARLDRDHEDATAWPLFALLAGVVALGALGAAQRRNYLRTNRVFNHGLLAATTASAVLLLWLVAAHTVASSQLGEARSSGQNSLRALNEARISSLKARANENLVLVARGAVLTDDGKNDKYETEYREHMGGLVDALGRAHRLADDARGTAPLDAAAKSVDEWQDRHEQVGRTDRDGDYEGALKKVIGGKESTGTSFDEVDAALDRALAHEQREFTRAAENGRGALGLLPVGAAVLGVLAALGAVLGINRRLSEYR
ncbi:hypothetical protein FQU76_09750 [Streptomyces qinzhouensis]|uniref:Secreted protein n=2 Tax=Streptomyces qinzhouensis TaxID=2599401 RepID=A0A5B8JSS1_9ACTN|nr:hypothetical protein [Streptomyces qinzhouensis]QDY80893.1 hypothetical protein FQU76_09750 [Streptomyces qinzhouensis]